MGKQLDLQTFRMQTYAHNVAKIVDAAGVESLWAVNLQHAPTVRTIAFNGRLDYLECLLASAKLQAVRLGFTAAIAALVVKQSELDALRVECGALQLATVDVAVLDPDWGKKGRGAKITAWIQATSATAQDVATRFQLALSTAKRYVRQARKPARSLAA
jgi:hypothetical protein